MKSTKYCIKANIDDKTLYYNLVNGTMLEIPFADQNKVDRCLEDPDDKKNEFWEEMYNACFVMDNEYDELKEIKARHWKTVFNANRFEITLIPTLKCNTDCIYCYQKGVNVELLEMTSKDYDELYNYLTGLSMKYININWYGGEPLLCKDKILEFCERLSKDTKHLYSYSISTNSSIFDLDFYEKMSKFGLTNIDTTLVGRSREHLGLRRSKCYGYDDVVKNIVNASKYVNVVVSINLCKTNTDSIIDLLNDFVEYADLPIYFSFTRIVSYENNPCEEIELEVDDYLEKVIQFANYAIDNGLKICDMSCFQNDGVYCGAYVRNNYTIGPGSYVYDCEHILSPEKAIGKIKDGNLIINNERKCDICIDPYEIEKCCECEILPYCNGGCHHLRKSGKDFCPDEKNYISEFLKLYYKKYYAEAKE